MYTLGIKNLLKLCICFCLLCIVFACIIFIHHIYAGALSYADDITLLCPSVWGLNEMLKICNKYRLENNIIFNSKKTVCIKFGSTIIEGESAFLTV